MIDNDLPPLPDKKQKRNGTLLFSYTDTLSLLIMQILGGVLKTHGNWVWGDITSDERAVNGSGPC
ncbi:hypothetical protein KAM622c_12310 [Klebsiella quasipneumoniae subsp. quasipneumoniae]|nr:hypothetical protein KAM622c_12310 [Klebsiella quasipneumoniae subsp. quasipneumoniae]